jgi:hemerythrin-like metal-binding protein
MDWKTEYATGIHNIDRQHQQIVEFITLFETISQDRERWHEAHPLILRTREFMQFHFSVEESLMQLLPYPLRHAHRAEHRREQQHIADIEFGVLRGTIRDSLAPQMRHCLFAHIAAADQQFAQYALRQFGQRPPAAGRLGASGLSHAQ